MLRDTGTSATPVTTGEAVRRPGNALTAAMVLDWMKRAQPNARLIYGWGAPWQTCAPTDVRNMVSRLQDAGLATSHFVKARGDQPAHHLLQRTKRPYLRGMKL